MKKWISLVAALCLMLSAAAGLAGQMGPGSEFAMVSGTSSLNLRQSPSAQGVWLGAMPRGSWVQVMQDQGEWAYVYSWDLQMSGYMMTKFLKRAGTAQGLVGSTFTVHNPGGSQFLNLRQYPSMDAPVLGIYYNGAQGTVLSEQDGWYHVEIGGVFGYFRGEYLRFNGVSANTYTNKVASAANGGSINVRLGPGYVFEVATQIRSGTTVKVFLTGKQFAYVEAAGRRGFIDVGFLGGGHGNTTVPGTHTGGANAFVTRTGKRLNLREKASLNARVLGSFVGGTKLVIKKQGTEWCRVVVQATGQEGFMLTRFITMTNMPGVNIKRVVHPMGSFVYLRSEPYKGNNVIMRVPHGKDVSVIAPEGSWTRVRYGSSVGYIASEFLR